MQILCIITRTPNSQNLQKKEVQNEIICLGPILHYCKQKQYDSDVCFFQMKRSPYVSRYYKLKSLKNPNCHIHKAKLHKLSTGNTVWRWFTAALSRTTKTWRAGTGEAQNGRGARGRSGIGSEDFQIYLCHERFGTVVWNSGETNRG